MTVRKILKKKRRYSVKVDGEKIMLRIPKGPRFEDEVLPLIESASDKNFGSIHKMVVACIRECVDEDLSSDEAFELMVISGGLAGELAQKCQDLCGMMKPEGAETDFPT